MDGSVVGGGRLAGRGVAEGAEERTSGSETGSRQGGDRKAHTGLGERAGDGLHGRLSCLSLHHRRSVRGP